MEQTADMRWAWETNTGSVIIITHKDKYLDLPKKTQMLLQDPNIIKVGRDIHPQASRVLAATRTKQTIEGCYDLGWGMNDLQYPPNTGNSSDPKIGFTEILGDFNDVRYPKQETLRKNQGLPYMKPWEDIDLEWKLGFVQNIRVSAYIMLRQIRALAEKFGLESDRNMMEYSRLLFATLSMDKPDSPLGMTLRRKMLPAARWLKEDVYYVQPTDRAWQHEMDDKLRLIAAYQQWIGGVHNSRFKQ